MIRLITRDVRVVHQHKGLVPANLRCEGSRRILRSLDPNSMKSGNYYNATELFFATLNNEIEQRRRRRRDDADK